MHDHAHQLTLGVAFGLGALHALEPGHGKTAMLVYLAGERRSLLHPVVMGLSSAITHSISLILVAAAVHLTHHLITGDHDHDNDNESVTHAMQWVSATLVIVVGVWMAVSAYRSKPTKCNCSSHKHQCDQKETTRNIGRKSSYSMSALLGVAFGLLPCPSAMAAYFTGMSAGSPVAAYGVIGLFAAGIAFSLSLVGMTVQVFGGRLIASKTFISRLPWAGIRAALILLIGFAYTFRLVSIS
ncbi:MAG: sulfite exporter TauE/SafE family protein [Planctomycetota bacterium]